MLNFRAPANILLSTLLHKAPSSSNSSEKAAQELFKQVQNVVEDKIKTEKNKHLLPYLQDNEKECTLLTTAEQQPISTHSDLKDMEQATSHLTHISDVQPNFQKTLDKDKNVKESKDQNISDVPLSTEAFNKEMLFCDIYENTKGSAESTIATEVPLDPQSLPVLMVTKAKTQTMDLSNATLPICLHLKDKNSLLVEAVEQDLKHVYFKTSQTIDELNKAAKTQRKTLYTKAEQLMKDPAVQNFLGERVASIYPLQARNSLSVFDPRSIAIANAAKSTNSNSSILDKAKQTMENIIGEIKKLFNKESKPEKKEKEEKKEDKMEKKSAPEGEK